MPVATKPRECRQPGCEQRIVLAFRMDTKRWIPLEATDVPAFTERSAGAFVLVGDQAWRPLDLIDHWQAYHEMSEPGARELVAQYPFHRPHYHHPTEERTDQS